MLIHWTKLKPGSIELEASFMPKSSSQGMPLLKAFSMSESSSVKALGYGKWWKVGQDNSSSHSEIMVEALNGFASLLITNNKLVNFVTTLI